MALNKKSLYRFVVILVIIVVILNVTAVAKLWVIDSSDPYDGYPPGYQEDYKIGDSLYDISDPGVTGTGIQGIYLDTLPNGEPLPTIGQYIQTHYPDIWNTLGAAEQARYNTMAAVWHVGASAPVLPKIVNDAIANRLAKNSTDVFPRVTQFPIANQVEQGTLFLKPLASPKIVIPVNQNVTFFFQVDTNNISSKPLTYSENATACGATGCNWEGNYPNYNSIMNIPIQPHFTPTPTILNLKINQNGEFIYDSVYNETALACGNCGGSLGFYSYV